MIGRRGLLQCGAACAAASACGKWVDEPIAVEVGTPVKNLISVPMARLPELAKPGGSVLLHADAYDLDGRRVSILVVHSTTLDEYRAFNGYCPHAGCELSWEDKSQSVVCPCHLSRFSVDGTVTHPPAVTNLEVGPAKLVEGPTLVVDVGAIIGALFPPAVNRVVKFAVADFPALGTVGGSVTGHSVGVPFPIVVLRSSATAVIACDARCTHLGCAVRGATKVFLCPCHGSVFNLDGSVAIVDPANPPPAKLPLTPLSVTFDGTTVTVHT